FQGKRHHLDAPLLQLSPDGSATSLRWIPDGGDRYTTVTGIEQQRGEIQPLELVQLEVDGATRPAELLGDRCKGGRAVGQRDQLIGPADDRRRKHRREGGG